MKELVIFLLPKYYDTKNYDDAVKHLKGMYADTVDYVTYSLYNLKEFESFTRDKYERQIKMIVSIPTNASTYTIEAARKKYHKNDFYNRYLIED